MASTTYGFKDCEQGAGCPFSRTSVYFKCDKKKKKKGVEREEPKIERIDLRCVYDNNDIVIDVTNRPRIKCWRELKFNQKK